MSEDIGEPIAWRVLERGTPVYVEGGLAVGVVRRVKGLPQDDIFDGIDIDRHEGARFVPAEAIAAIHEHAVALRLSEAQVAALGEPERGPAAMEVDDDTLTSKRLFSMRNLLGDTWNRMIGR